MPRLLLLLAALDVRDRNKVAGAGRVALGGECAGIGKVVMSIDIELLAD
jgi:hypothetical protein